MTETIEALRSALNNDLYRLNSVSQNLANVSTAGYKREVTTFNNPVTSGEQPEVNLQLNATLQSKQKNLSQGALNYTGNDADISLDSSAFFVVTKGGIKYGTRVGSLTISEEGKLVGAHGEEFQSKSGSIYLDPGKFKIDEKGIISQNNKVVDQLLVVNGSKAGRSGYIGEGFYTLAAEETTDAALNTRVRQGYTEASNVSTMDEMIQLIDTTRHFESIHGVMRSYDDMMGMAINKLAEF